MAEVSVIVPVYNAEKTLSRSVESVLAQTELDWELWLVNDGSSDGSLALCREYEAADPRIHVIDKPNGGVGSARNAGLDAAAGEYVAFLDSDDAYEPNFLKTLLTLAKRESAPVVCGSVREVYPEKNGEEKADILKAGVFRTPKDILQSFFLDDPDWLFVCWNKLFRRELIGDTRFSALAIGEDALFCTELLTRCDVYAVTDEIVCRYYIYTGSSMHKQTFSLRRLDHLTSWLSIYDLAGTVSEPLRRYISVRIVHMADIYYEKCAALEKTQRKMLRRYLTKIHRRFYFRQYERISLRKIIAAAVHLVSPRLFYYLAKRVD